MFVISGDKKSIGFNRLFLVYTLNVMFIYLFWIISQSLGKPMVIVLRVALFIISESSLSMFETLIEFGLNGLTPRLINFTLSFIEINFSILIVK